ncbi:hypothetical protein KB20921_09020 [Edwardsiella ictaluri]|nr:hypothetical protein KH20906_08930 [Edwardsiella ictaluri]BEI01641.1 hypothetical protein KB20921_09020 [Edwardsiella ictaluri]BEI05110.1 hypothetical protein KH201010_08960 [Edwardsiella ictaluri]BEI08565.1 hypothetical protein STU22726_08960 [Edwardsiella ictaluri]BEI12048.1 hypothetical protein STU22816_09010 [Edwardsiella ictaluri]
MIKLVNPAIRIIGIWSENVHGMAASYYTGEIVAHRTNGRLAGGSDLVLGT